MANVHKGDSIASLLFQSVCDGNIQKIHTLIEQGCDVNCNNIPYCLLHAACYFDHPDCLEILLRNGAYVETRDEEFNFLTPFLYASMQGKLQCVKVLVKYHANVNALSPNNMCALDWACSKHPNVELLKLLLKSGVSVHSINGMDVIERIYDVELKIKVFHLLMGAGVQFHFQYTTPPSLLTLAREKMCQLLLSRNSTNIYVIVPALRLPTGIQNILVNFQQCFDDI